MAAISSGNLCYKKHGVFQGDPQSSPWEEQKTNGRYLRKPSKSKEFGLSNNWVPFPAELLQQTVIIFRVRWPCNMGAFWPFSAPFLGRSQVDTHDQWPTFFVAWWFDRDPTGSEACGVLYPNPWNINIAFSVGLLPIKSWQQGIWYWGDLILWSPTSRWLRPGWEVSEGLVPAVPTCRAAVWRVWRVVERFEHYVYIYILITCYIVMYMLNT